MGKRNHYAPEFLLRQFIEGDSGLWELNKSTGVCEQRNPSNAGMIRGLYLDALEEGYLQEIDGKACTILRSFIYDGDTILLTDEQRRWLSEWLATLVHRNPKKLADAEEFVAKATDDPHSVIDPDKNYGIEYVEALKREHPDLWYEQFGLIKSEEALQEAIAEIGIEEVLIEIVIRAVNKKIHEGDITTGDENPKDIFCRLINRVRSQEWAQWILKYHWSWWRTDQEFIMGDDPVCCWSPKFKHVEYGVGHPDCEVTFPVSRKLCLVMRQTPIDSQTVKVCDGSTTAMYNNRQWLAASRFLYGSSNKMAREKRRWDDIRAGRMGYPKGG